MQGTIQVRMISCDMYRLHTGSGNEKFLISLGFTGHLPEIRHLFWSFPVAWFPPYDDFLRYIVFLPLMISKKWRKSSWAVEKSKRTAGSFIHSWKSFPTNVPSPVTAGEWSVNEICRPPPITTLLFKVNFVFFEILLFQVKDERSNNSPKVQNLFLTQIFTLNFCI